MGATKYEIYDTEAIELAEIFKALAHPARIHAIRKMLLTEDHLNCEQLREDLDLSQSAFSRHLKQLSDVGITKSRVITRNNKSCLCYYIQKDVFDIVFQFVNYVLTSIDYQNRIGYTKIPRFYSKFRTKIDWSVQFQT